VIGRPGIASRYGSEAEVVNRHGPLLKNIRDRRAALSEDAQELPAAVVGVVIRIELCMLGFDRDRPSLLSNKLWHKLLFRFGRISPHAIVAAHISGRSENALLFAAP